MVVIHRIQQTAEIVTHHKRRVITRLIHPPITNSTDTLNPLTVGAMLLNRSIHWARHLQPSKEAITHRIRTTILIHLIMLVILHSIQTMDIPHFRDVGIEISQLDVILLRPYVIFINKNLTHFLICISIKKRG